MSRKVKGEPFPRRRFYTNYTRKAAGFSRIRDRFGSALALSPHLCHNESVKRRRKNCRSRRYYGGVPPLLRTLRKGEFAFMRRLWKQFFALVLTALFLMIPATAYAISHMNDSCTIEIHAEDVDMKKLTDYNYASTVKFNEGDWFRVTWTDKRPVAAVYWEWRSIPKRALVECLNDAGEVVSSREYANKIRFLTVFPEEGVREIRMTVLEGSGQMSEMFTYDTKQIPSKAVVWEEPLDKADIMLVETHGNDDVLIFGAVIPTYVDRGYKIQVADIACDTIGRQRESSGGSYHVGLRNFKTFFAFSGDHTYDYNTFAEKWFSKSPDPYEKLTAEIRRVRPEVVITHDIENGDNGDGSHKLTAEIVLKCIETAADPEQHPDSAAKYGAWQVKKLYMHMASENPIKIDIDTPLESFGGKTAYELSVEGITLWHSLDGGDQGMINAVKNRKYAPCDYGLVFSAVGEDVLKNDFLENIPPESLSDYIPPTPAPTEVPTPEPTPEPTPDPTEEPTPVQVEALTPEPTAVPTEAPVEIPPAAPAAQSIPLWVWLVMGGALLLLSAALILVIRKLRR